MKILCIGQCSYDLIFHVDGYPVEDSKNVASGFSHTIGGPAANAAVLCARWGAQSWFCGRSADDALGVLQHKQLAESGVCTDLFVLTDKARTPVSSIIVHNKNSTRTVVNYRESGSDFLNFPDFTNSGFSAVLTDGHEPEGDRCFLDKFPGVIRVLDAGSFRPATARLFSRVDWPVCSEVFARNAAACSEINPENAREILTGLSGKYKNKNTAITLGDRGLVWKEQDKFFYLPAFPVSAVDSSAAGDIFHGALTWFLASGKPVGEAMLNASAAAALSVTRKGSCASAPGIRETLELPSVYPEIRPTSI